jgi:heme-degrading monooxygenase HmoA
MPHMLIHHTVRDFGKWKPFFDGNESTRKAMGSKSAVVFQSADNPTDVFILMEWDSLENAKKFVMSADLKKTMEKAGVMGVPHVHFLKEVQKSKA